MKNRSNRLMYTLAAGTVLLGVYLFSMERSSIAQNQIMDADEQLNTLDPLDAPIPVDVDLAPLPAVEDPQDVQEEPLLATGKTMPVDLEGHTFDVEKKRAAVQALIKKGMDFFNTHSIEDSARAFAHSKDFVTGELYIFLYDTTGRCLAHGEQTELIWQNLIDLRDVFGAYIVRDFIKMAEAGGGWLTYRWKGATKVSLIQPLVKDKKAYLIGCGYYPHAKRDTVISLVRGAATRFQELTRVGWSDADAFGTLSYPLGDFVMGDLYIYALDFEGNIMAQGDRPGLIGQNSLDYRDSNGQYTNKEIIKALEKSGGQGVWVDYFSRRALKSAYAQMVTGAEGTKYFIACGYYPDATRDQAQDLVRRGYQLMKKSGLAFSIQEFSDKRSEEYRYGDLYLEVYDMKGVCMAHGGNEEYVGRNMLQMKDQDGREYVKEYIREAQSSDHRGWVDVKLKNSFKSVYVEKIDLGTNAYIIACGLYPISKDETMRLLVKSAANKMEVDKDVNEAFEAFTSLKYPFIRGDLGVFVFDAQGLCYVYSQHYELIWRNLINQKDDDGRPFVQMMIEKSAQGAGTIDIKLNGAVASVYVEPVTLGNKKYVVGSMYYL